jgi:hypothetical protein
MMLRICISAVIAVSWAAAANPTTVACGGSYDYDITQRYQK